MRVHDFCQSKKRRLAARLTSRSGVPPTSRDLGRKMMRQIVAFMEYEKGRQGCGLNPLYSGCPWPHTRGASY
jgi:hypothetical protein